MPFGQPQARLAAAIGAAGALGVLDVRKGNRADRAAVSAAATWTDRLGLRIGPDSVSALPLLRAAAGSTLDVVVLDCPATARRAAELGESLSEQPFLVEVVSLDEAVTAVRLGAAGVLARGSEAGGRVGESSAFVLLQQLVADDAITVPVWLCGAMAPRTAAAAMIAGARGVVLDVQLALLAESDLPHHLVATLSAVDGTETEVVDGHRVLRRRSIPGQVAQEPLPIGQDAYLAAWFRDEYGTAAAAVRAIHRAIDGAVGPEALAAATSLLSAGGPAAAALGSRLPVAQGPMTRVSDQPEFASAVADSGAAAFVALATASGEQTRQLLDQTAQRCAGKPWGVGILGFVPDELKAAQLAAVSEVRPPLAIIAGGRPAQAAKLEELGIRTYLHVPSPILLDQFLAAGARRFVFEGAECGGHIGPRSSFALWAAQIEVVTRALDGPDAFPAEDLSVLFAGGVHDERSAAAVAALAAPLAARGVAVGLLMGTAYLFTEEAVRHGAVRPLFQRKLVEAGHTELLTTAPGHATRCLPSEFTAEFGRVAHLLQEQGVPERSRWARLEELNVGRLRIASKGLRREGDHIVTVDERQQDEQGLFMAGQVATLRGEVTTLDQLHAQVSSGAIELLEQRADVVRQWMNDTSASTEGLDIAVVGMACSYPGGTDLAAFWDMVLRGGDAISEVPPSRWDTGVYYDEEVRVGRTTQSKWGAFLPPMPFDPLKYGIQPKSLASIDPVQLLALSTADAALTDAGVTMDARTRSRTCVIFGAESGSDLANAVGLRIMLPGWSGELDETENERLPVMTADSFPGMLANVVSGRIANRMDLGGTNYTVDAACASSLAAVDIACKELVSGTADLAVCGGADLHNGINDYLLFSSVQALSPTGGSRPFDQDSDGITLGEGVGCLILKRLADARRDGDRVYAVIAGVGSSSDGRSLGLTAPRAQGQRAAVSRAYNVAGFSPAEVSLVEAHGTGTVVGDRTELTAITAVLEEYGAEPGSVALGSVKAQIGHTKCAAGAAGLIKAVLSVHTGVLPPAWKVERPNPAWQQGSPFVFLPEPRPWPVPATARKAGISAFGFGGTNFHVAVSGMPDGPPPRHGRRTWPAELLLFAGRDNSAVADALRAAADLAERRVPLRDVAAAACARAEKTGLPTALAVVTTDLDHLRTLLTRALAGETDPAAGLFRAVVGDEPGGIGLLMPGQGSQRLRVFSELFGAFPQLQRYLDPAVAAVAFPGAAYDDETAQAQHEAVTDTRVAQPLLGATGMAAYELLTTAGVTPDALAGHSYGELVALAASGALDPSALTDVSIARAKALLDAATGDPGKMAAVSAAAPDVAAGLKAAGIADKVVIANYNAPAQVVVSGPSDDVDGAVEALRANGLTVRPLKVACAFHSPVVAGAAVRFADFLAGQQVQNPEVPVWSNRTAEVYPGDVRTELAAQLVAPVRFADQVLAMHDAGIRTFVEAGPGSVLTGLVKKVLADKPHVALGMEERGHTGIPGFLRALAALAVRGVPVRTSWLFRERANSAPVPPPSRPQWTVDGHLVRDANGVPLSGGLRPTDEPRPKRVAVRPLEPALVRSAVGHSNEELFVSTTVPTVNGVEGPDSRLAAVTQFLHVNSLAVSAQRDVVLAFLGSPALPAQNGHATFETSNGSTTTDHVPMGGRTPAPVAPVVAVPVDTKPAAMARPEVFAVVRQVVAERTGYPEEMIEPGLDLEADLSVDSIKRTEVAAELVSRVGVRLTSADDESLEDLSKARTADAITDWLFARITSSPAEPTAAKAGQPTRELSRAEVFTVVRQVVAERTGYPEEMIEPGLDLEADLSVDSIKRTEVAAELVSRVGVQLTSADDESLEDLSKARTADAITDWLYARISPTPVVEAQPPAPAATEVRAVEPVRTEPQRPMRYLWRNEPIEADGEGRSLVDTRFALLGGPAEPAQTLADALNSLGAKAECVDEDTKPAEQPDGFIYLGALDSSEVLPDAFPVFKDALATGPRWCLAVAPASVGEPVPGRSAGLRGLFRTMAKEFPQTVLTLVEVPAESSAEQIAQAVTQEITQPSGRAVVQRRGGFCYADTVVRAELGPLASAGAGPADDGSAEAAAIGLDRDSVVLLLGGARGITSRCAAALAAASRCHIELVGSTEAPDGPEDPVTAAATDRTALRAVLASDGRRAVADIEPLVRKLLAQREITATITELEGIGVPVRYRQADVRDSAAVRALVLEIYAEYGRLDGVVHGAGINLDQLMSRTSPESFRAVYDTKVDAARALLDATAGLPVPPSFAVLFGSIAAVLGSRGQVGYASANDTFETLTADWARRTGGRGLTLHWGPWAPVGLHAGMVSAELHRDFQRRGLGTIDPQEGAMSLLRELAWAAEPTTSVLYAPAGWVAS
ncbi:type I polyketide synthase [Kibdelosporangium aridum]|nr:type I polyketide synthase [Kibdelosporangium aridum]